MSIILTTWPFAALAIALAILARLCLGRGQSWGARLRDRRWLFWLGVPLYMLHQFEEHGYDLYGRRYHFQAFMCETLGFADTASCPADQEFIFAVNVGAVWIGALLGALLGPARALIGAAAYAVPLVNGFAHIVPAIVQGAYNPGLLTGAVLFVPLSLWVLATLRQQGRITGAGIALAVFAGVALHAIMLASLQARAHGLIGQAPLLAIQVALGFMPLLVGALRRS
jgi:hypothetical protein